MRRAWARLAAMFRRNSLDRDLDEQVRSHLQLLEDEYIAQGMSPREARDRARRDFGGVDQIKEVYRDQRSYPVLENLWQDLRHSFRLCRRNPAFTVAAVISIALGIGANTAVFSLFNAILLSRLPVAHPQELISIAKTGGPVYFRGFSYPLFVKLRDRHDLYQDIVAATHTTRVRLTASASSGFAWKEYVSGNYFQMLGVHPTAGKLITDGEAQYPGAMPVAVLSYDFWRDRFAGRSDAIGQAIRIDDTVFTIVGVAAQGFRGIDTEGRVDVWLPLGCYDASWMNNHGANWLRLLARRLPAVPNEAVRSAVQTMYEQDVRDHLKTNPWGRDMLALRTEVEPAAGGLSYLKEQFAGPLQVLFVLTSVLLVIACANVAGLLLARGSARRKEIAMRLSIGASRLRILQQWLTESFVLAFSGGVLGIALASWTARMLVAFLPSTDNLILPDVGLDRTVLLFALAATTVSALAFGGLSAWRSLAFDPAPALKETNSAPRTRLLSRRALLVTEVALCVVLLAGAGLFARTLASLRWIDPGFRQEGVLTFWLDLPKNYKAADSASLHTKLLDSLNTMPGVVSASTATTGPYRGGRMTGSMVIFTPQGRRTAFVDEQIVTQKYFETLGVTPVRGRLFEHSDRGAAQLPAVVNQNFAREYFGTADPTGSTISLDPDKVEVAPRIRIVGVVPDIRHYGLREKSTPYVYILQDERRPSSSGCFLVRANVPPDTLLPAIRRQIQDLDQNAAITSAITLEQTVNGSLVRERLLATLSAIFGLLALALAAVGLYGLLSYVVVQRTSEIGVRIALGATRGNVLRLVMRDALVLLGAGVAIGLPAAFAVSQLAASFLYGVKPNDPATVIGAALLMIATGAVAAFIPSRRAASTDPITALRYE